MLEYDRFTQYMIYPSWANFWYEWKDVSLMLKDPLKTGFFVPEDFEREPEILEGKIPSRDYELIDGPAGGGIIVIPLFKRNATTACGLEWKGINSILFKPSETEIQVSSIFGLPSNSGVLYMKPHAPSFLVKHGILKRPKAYDLFGTFEHVESADKSLYASVVLYKSKRQFSKKYVDVLTSTACSLGLSLTPLDDIPPSIFAEKPHWCSGQDRIYIWFKVHTECKTVQRIFAMLYYCGLHLRKVFGKGLRGIMLAAKIETKPCSTMMLPFLHTEEERNKHFK